MFKRLSKQDDRRALIRLMEEQLFCILYPTLRRISREYDELTPAEVWYEAIDFATQLMRMSRPDMMREDFEEMMHDKYLCFETDGGNVERSEQQAQRTTFLVMATMLYMLATENKDRPGNPYKPHCLMLAEATQHHELRQRFLDEVRETETEEELRGRRVEMVKMELEVESNEDVMARSQVVNNWVECALQYGEDVIKNQILLISELNAQYNGEFKRQEQRLRDALKKLVKSAHEGDAIQAQTEFLKEIAKTPKQQFTVYPQPGSTANLGCDQKNSDFKTYLPGTDASEEQSMLESK